MCQPEEVTLKVMTWNVWWRFGNWQRREDAIVATIAEQAPDIVCLQETWAWRHDVDNDSHGEHQAHRLAERLGWHAVVNDPLWFGERAFSNAVLSRWPLERTADEILPRSDGSRGHRRVIGASVATPWGPWPVVSTHLDHFFDGSAGRELHARRLLEVVVERRGDPKVDLPVVLCADLNAVPDSDEVRLLTGRKAGGPEGVILHDVWEQVGEGTGITWRRDNPHVATSSWPNRRLDYVMVSWPRRRPIGNPVSATLVGTTPVDLDGELVWASDHAAVLVELSTPDDTTISAEHEM
jgi:endonuclease/exonuclease/phosphatase family metal-dependent hydrolase